MKARGRKGTFSELIWPFERGIIKSDLVATIGQFAPFKLHDSQRPGYFLLFNSNHPTEASFRQERSRLESTLYQGNLVGDI